MENLVAPNPAGRFFVSLGFSCGMGNFDQTEDYLSCDSTTGTCTEPIRPIPERLLLDPQKGAIAVIGPTRGSFQHGNTLFAREIAKELAVAGRDLRTGFMIAQSNCMVKYPHHTNLFRSYVLLGDPLIGGPIVTGVSDSPRGLRPSLSAPRPNPFNPTTTLVVTLAASERVHLRIFDAQGRLVRRLLRGELLKAGTTPVQWDGRDQAGNFVASGVYLAKMEASGLSFRQKLVLLK